MVTDYMVIGIAYKAACVLRLEHSKSIKVSLHETTNCSDSSWLDDEVRRRCFWATWLTNCINSEHYARGTSINKRIMDLPLPMDSHSFRTATRTPLVTTRLALDELDSWALSHDRPQHLPSVMAELVKLMMIWQVHFS